MMEVKSEDWKKRSACKGMDASIFYKEEKDADYSEARAVCARCPVQVDCLMAGMGEQHGIWGGLSVRERRRYRRVLRIIAEPEDERSILVWETLALYRQGLKTSEIARRYGVKTDTVRRLVVDGETAEKHLVASA